jgi:adenine-specific DNA-methyltransferase
MAIELITPDDDAANAGNAVAANLAALRNIFPELITEGSSGAVLDIDVLKTLLGDQTVTDADEKYGLSWPGKRQARQLSLTPPIGTLRPCQADSVDWETTENLVIEGDNLETLKLLKKSYTGKVGLIYIDPPYNTGNDFVYPDDFKQGITNYLELTQALDEDGRKLSSNLEISGRFHTDWLNMIYPRIKCAHELLAPTGALFASIDSNEAPRLRLVLDDLFGEENFVAEIAASLNPKGRQLGNFFATSHETLFCYAKSIDDTTLDAGSTENVNESDFPKVDDDGNRYRLLPLRNTNKRFNPVTAPTMHYPLFGDPKTGRVSTEAFDESQEILPVFGDATQAVWRWSRPKVDNQPGDLLAREVAGQTGPRIDIFQIDRLTADRTKKLPTIWPAAEVGSTDSAVNEVKALLGPVFQTVKPLQLMERIVARQPPSSTVLDFFAGSGTTGHAVMAQNAQDGGTRRFILVQLPEPLDPGVAEQKAAADLCDELDAPRNIAELTKERLRRAAKKVAEEHPEYTGDLGFRVFRLDSSNIRTWDPHPDDLAATLEEAADHVKADRTNEDVLYEILLKLGIDLCVPIETHDIAGKPVQSVGGGALIACLTDTITTEDAEPLATGIAQWHKELAPAGDTTCIFRDNAFQNDVAKTNLAAILEQHGITTTRSI